MLLYVHTETVRTIRDVKNAHRELLLYIAIILTMTNEVQAGFHNLQWGGNHLQQRVHPQPAGSYAIYQILQTHAQRELDKNLAWHATPMTGLMSLYLLAHFVPVGCLFDDVFPTRPHATGGGEISSRPRRLCSQLHQIIMQPPSLTCTWRTADQDGQWGRWVCIATRRLGR